MNIHESSGSLMNPLKSSKILMQFPPLLFPVAEMTAQIRSMQEYMEQFPRNKAQKVKLKELIEKRKRFLRLLRTWDYKRFEWLIEKLNIIFKPHPEKFHWITRKESMRKLTKIHCTNIRKEKLENYRKELESKQLDFLVDKIKNLEFIRQEQQECRVPVTVTSEEIQIAKKQYEELKKKREEEEELSKKLKKFEDYELNL
jgi:small subunit ribosomal protein S15